MKKLFILFIVTLLAAGIQAQNIENQLGTGGEFLIKNSDGTQVFNFKEDQIGQPELIIAKDPFSISNVDTYQFQVQSSALLGPYVAFTNPLNQIKSGNLHFYKSRNTNNDIPPFTLAAADDNDEIGTISYGAYNGTAFKTVADITGQVDGTGNSNPGGELIFSTKLIDVDLTSVRMTIKSDGTVNVTNLYDTGSGTGDRPVFVQSNGDLVAGNSGNAPLKNKEDRISTLEKENQILQKRLEKLEALVEELTK